AHRQSRGGGRREGEGGVSEGPGREGGEVQGLEGLSGNADGNRDLAGSSPFSAIAEVAFSPSPVTSRWIQAHEGPVAAPDVPPFGVAYLRGNDDGPMRPRAM